MLPIVDIEHVLTENTITERMAIEIMVLEAISCC